MAAIVTAGGCGWTYDASERLDSTLDQTESKVRVLLVEDDDEMRGLLKSILHADGYDVVEAATGREGVSCIYDAWGVGGRSARHLDLIISDVRMPGWGGLDLLDVVRRVRMGIPVLLITAFGAPETHQEAARLGAGAVLDKPFALDTFRSTVALMLQHGPAGCGL
jgi:DNA-binding NtrC family response regulator